MSGGLYGGGIMAERKKCAPFWEHLQFRDERMDSRGAGGPDSEIFRIADH